MDSDTSSEGSYKKYGMHNSMDVYCVILCTPYLCTEVFRLIEGLEFELVTITSTEFLDYSAVGCCGQ